MTTTTSVDTGMRQIAETKLSELKFRRDSLCNRYAEIERAAQEAPTALARLLALYEGLRDTKFGQDPLHPDVANLADVFAGLSENGMAPHAIKEWTERIECEVKRGKSSAEYAFLFGSLLDEWARETQNRESDTSVTNPEFARSVVDGWNNPCPPADTTVIDALFEAYPAAFVRIRRHIADTSVAEAGARVTTREVDEIVSALRTNIYRHPGLRCAASLVAADPLLQSEYAGALTILLNHPEQFAWPASGVPFRTLWARNKWRPYLDHDLFTSLFLEVVGQRWARCAQDWHSEHIEGKDGIYASSPKHKPPRSSDYYSHDDFFLQSMFGLENCYSSSDLAMEAPDELERLIAGVHKRVIYERAIFPADPVFILRVDLKDFNLSLPHDLVLHFLRRLGIPSAWLKMLETYLKVPVQLDASLYQPTRGVFPDHNLSFFFCELTLLLLDLQVFLKTGLRVHRLLDDIVLISRSKDEVVTAWETIQNVCARARLEVNEAKSGSLCIPPEGTVPEGVTGLPRGEVRLGLLSLTEEGTWTLDRSGLDSLASSLRGSINRSRSVLEKVSAYNTYAKFALRNIAPFADLGEGHLEMVSREASRLHLRLFGENRGIEETIRSEIDLRWPSRTTQSTDRLPNAMLCWPITGGGLGLFDPLCSLASIRARRRDEPPPVRPQRPPDGEWWEESGNPWRTYFWNVGDLTRPRRPIVTLQMKGLLWDFVARGKELRGEEIDEDDDNKSRPWDNLAAYWQWVVSCHGPTLIKHFGSFRFLETALIPLQLIVQGLVSATVLDEDKSSP